MNAERQCPQLRQPRRGASLRRAALATLAPLGLLAPLLASSPALAQEERTTAPSLPEAAGDDAAPESATGDRVQTLEERLNELNERIRESEEARAKAVSPLSWNGYV